MKSTKKTSGYCYSRRVPLFAVSSTYSSCSPITARLADDEAADRPGDRKEQRTNHLHQRDCRKAIQEECMSHRLTTNHGITVKAPLKWEPVIKIVWCNWREIAWEDEVVVVNGPCGRCRQYDVLVELDRQLICRYCLQNEEASLAQVVSRNKSKRLQNAE